jgi:YVTN family beta-propeller protein
MSYINFYDPDLPPAQGRPLLPLMAFQRRSEMGPAVQRELLLMKLSARNAQPKSLIISCTRFILVSLTLFLVKEGAAQSFNRPTYSSPIALSQDDRLLWVVNPSDDSVSVIRTDDNTRLSRISVGDEPQSVALTPNNQYVFVANAAGNSVTAIRITDSSYDYFNAAVDPSFGVNGQLTTGAEPWNIVSSPDGRRIFVANSGQDTITVIDATTRSLIGHVQLRLDPFANHIQPRGMAVTADNTKLYVTRFLSFARPGGRQGDDFGKEGLVTVLNINTASSYITDYTFARTVTLAPQVTGFRFPGLTNDTGAFPNQLQSIVIRGDRAYLPNIAASPTGPLRFNLDTQAFVNAIGGVNSASPSDLGAVNLHLGARDPEPGKPRLFFANPWAIGFSTQSGAGSAYIVSAASDLLVKLNVAADGSLGFTGDGDTTRYIDLNDPNNPMTGGASAGKNPQGIAINSAGTRAYVANFVSRNVSVVDLTTDAVVGTVQTSALPTPGSQGETNLVGAEIFFSSRGNFDSIPGTNSLRNRLSNEGWQSCSSCHFKGLTDGVVWQFAAGPRKSVPLNASFSPHNRNQQRVLNYSAIFDEVEDFEINIRNVSGPGSLATPINGNSLDPNHGLLIGDDGDLNVAPSAINSFALPNANRAQLTVTLPGSPNRVPALTALREWVRFAVRTPNALVPGLPGAHPPTYVVEGRNLFAQAGCAQCHGGLNWTVSIKDFTSPVAAAEILTERTPAPVEGNPVATQYLNRFLYDIGSFNIGVPEQNNPLGNDIGADEKAAPGVTGGVLQPAQDGLGHDYNDDGRGIGFNVPSLLGIAFVPPFLHNGAAESLMTIVGDVNHRTANGRWPDRLSNPQDQIKVFAFLEYIDATTVPFVPLNISQNGNQLVLSFDSINGVRYGIERWTNSLTGTSTIDMTVTGTGQRLDVPIPQGSQTQFLRLVQAP